MIRSIVATLAPGLALRLGSPGFVTHSGTDLTAFDKPADSKAMSYHQRFSSGPKRNADQRAVIASLKRVAALVKKTPRLQQLRVLREHMDNFSGDRTFDAQFIPVDAGGVPAEWVIAPGADSRRRTLYIHGGAWIMGSARGHRAITTRFSEISGGAVLAIDYRLMPEHSRMDGIEDCRNSYRWMLEHSPDDAKGAAPARAVYVAGDSAGGNLTLSLIAWLRDQGLRAPDAAVALSPATDGTMGSPSLRANVRSDAMLGPLLGPLSWVPRSALLSLYWLRTRIRPSHPVVSPIFGNLAGLPPVLIQASEVEMLLDDSVRYTHKARAAGSAVTLQTWSNMVHVWHIFDPNLAEASQAFEEIRKFLARPRAA